MLLDGTPIHLVGDGVDWELRSARAADHGVPVVDATARVHGTAELGAGSVVGAEAVVGADAVVGAGTVISVKVVIGSGVILGVDSFVGEAARIGADACVGSRTTIGSGTEVRGEATIGSDCSIGDECRIGTGAAIGSRTTLGAFTVGGGFTEIGRDSFLADFTRVTPRLILAPFTSASGSVAESRFRCDLDGPGDAEPLSLTAEDCLAAGGVTLGRLPTRSTFDGARLDLDSGSVPQLDPATAPPDVAETVEEKIASLEATGIPARTYVERTHDCDDFAAEAEQHFTDEGCDATFTIFMKLNPDYSWDVARWVPKWIDSHAVVDLHLSDGSVAWIEPQAGFAGRPHAGTLDRTRDGRVSFVHGLSDEPTEWDAGPDGVPGTPDDGNCHLLVEVFDDAEEARKLFGPLD